MPSPKSTTEPTPPPPRSRTIAPEHHAAVLARLAETNPETLRPYTCAEVAAWLGSAHKVAVSRYAVERLRAAHEKHTDAQRVQALRDELRDLIAPTKAKLARALVHLDSLVPKSKSVRDVSGAVSAATRALDSLSDLSGVSAPTHIDVSTSDAVTLVWPDAAPGAPADGDAPPAAPAAG